MKRTHGAILRAVIAGGACASILLVAACGGKDSGTGNSGSQSKLVYFMAPNTTPTRYIQQDGPAFEKAIKALDPSVVVKFVNAGGDSNQQLAQANAAIAAGAKALVVVAADPNTSAGLLQAAAQAKVPVIGYENPPVKGTLYGQVVFDPEKVGAQQAKYFAEQVAAGKLGAKPVKVARQYGNKGDVYTTQMLAGQNQVLDPLIKSGDITVVCEDYIKDWAPDNATKATEQCLTKTQNSVGAFLGFYDGITAGIIAALKGKNLKIPVYGGQNPELTGLQYMLTGDQQDNVLKAFKVEAEAAAKITIAAIGGQQPPADLVKDTIDNGAMKVPTAKLDATLIHLEEGKDPGDAVQQAVDLGMFTWQQICTGPAAETATCKTKNK
ncbi:substrate-binding domain-containing protein [Dactylosporangium sp. NPDC051485]|uniref:substrate-binding domain-containing protein n=1 Tax=Dactylosporangium sp. NPDC051485 TaxID=3154846 RepID=UPI00342358AD